MVDDDHWMKQQPADQINTAAQSLITRERTQKLDLLIHLLSNLTQALVVCGPEGIGKTMLLTVLQERKTELWQYCFMQGNADVSFEAMQKQLAKFISQDESVQSLSMALGQYQGQHKQIVLIVDNAGELVPGLITAIIQYAAANPILRVIFALTHDELQVKRGSDRVVDDCHIVEIPTLSEKQCGDFLRYLSAKPATNLSFKAISENMIAQIYRETHGVPGRIITELSGLSGVKQGGGKLKWIFALAVAAVCAIAFGARWLASPSSKNTDKKVIASTSAEQKAGNIEIAPPRSDSQIMLTPPPVQPVIEQQEHSVLALSGTEVPANALEPSSEVKTSRDDQQSVTSTAKPEAVSTAVVKQFAVDALRSSAHPTSLGVKQEKPEQSELSKTVNDVGASIPEKLAIKAPSAPVSAAGADQKFGNKQSDVTQVNMAERLWAKQEKLKQAELSKKINSVEPLTPNNPEIIQIPKKSVDVAVAPQQAKPEGLSAPSANNFTLQLMVLSKQSSVNNILKKYPSVRPDFRVINMVANGQEKFILEYGSYPDTASANKARQTLPFEFRNALVRKISSTKHR